MVVGNASVLGRISISAFHTCHCRHCLCSKKMRRYRVSELTSNVDSSQSNMDSSKGDLSTYVQPTLFSLPNAKPLLCAGLTCNNCEHRQRWQCNSKVFQYCGVRKSNRTENGLLKIKCKDAACPLYKPCI